MDLRTHAERLTKAAALVTRLADLTEATAADMPVGYVAQRPEDGVKRPVEDIIIARQERGVTYACERARSSLLAAIYSAESCARQLDHAVSLWEGDTHTVTPTTPSEWSVQFSSRDDLV